MSPPDAPSGSPGRRDPDPAPPSDRRGLDPLLFLPIAAYVDEVDEHGHTRTVYGSRKYRELSGYDPDRMRDDSMFWDERVHPDDRAAYLASFERLWRVGEDQDVVYRFRRSDERWIWLRDQGSATYDAARRVTVISGVLSDVTREEEARAEAERVRAALEAAVDARTAELARSLEEVRAGRENLARAQELAHAGSFEWSPAGGFRLSEELRHIYGLDVGASMDRAAAVTAVHPEDRDAFSGWMRAAAREGGQAEFRYRIVRPDGGVRSLDARVEVERDTAGAPVRLVGSVQDVTERRRAEEALRRGNELLQLIAELSAGFVTMPVEATDQGILDALGHIGGFVGADRAYLFLLDPSGDSASKTHEWCAPGIESQQAELQTIPTRDFPWWVGRLTAGETIVMERRSALPPEAEAERRSIVAQGIRSLLNVPMFIGDRPIGYVGFDAVRHEVVWPGDTILLLRTVAGALAGALERRRAQEALAESEANYRALFDAADDVILVCDTAGRILHANPAAARTLGMTLEELRRLAFLDLHPEDVRAEAAAVFGEVLGGARAARPLPLRDRRGDVVPVATHVWHGTWNGEPCVFTTSRDLTTEQELLQRFDRLFHGNPAPMTLNETSELRYVDVNDAFLETLGCTRDEVVGVPLADLGIFPETDLERVAADLLNESTMRGVELKVKARDGRLLDGVFSGEVVESQGTRYLLTVMLDITERKRAEEELLRLNATLEQRVAERTGQLSAANRELEGFVQSVAHDLRGPLRTIGSFGQILLLDHAAELDAEGRDALQRIVRANARMARLIDGLLELSGFAHHPLRTEPVDLSALTREVAEELREREPGRDVEVVVADGMRAQADPVLIRIVLDNLLGNAWKFTAQRAAAHIAVATERHDGQTVFCVRDDGAGFDPRYAHRLFSAFERLHDDTEFGGTGIGLATVKRIVERHGGRVWAQGEVDRGATFNFTLPEEPGAARVTEAAGAATAAPPRQSFGAATPGDAGRAGQRAL